MKLKTGNKKLRIIGLTGGIASGKTTVLNEFKKFSVKTTSCDEIAEEIFYKTDIQKKIKKLFKTLSRNKIAKIIFSDSAKRKHLEKILHPEIIKQLKKQLFPASPRGAGRATLNSELSTVVVDAPLLFEANIEYLFDKIIVVYCRKSQQLKRLCIRDNISRQEAGRRIGSQIPLLIKLKWADCIIDNTGTRHAVREQIEFILKNNKCLKKKYLTPHLI